MITTYQELIKYADDIVEKVGVISADVDITVFVVDARYNAYIRNPENSLEAYEKTGVRTIIVLPDTVDKSLPIISFKHRSGLRVHLKPKSQDINN